MEPQVKKLHAVVAGGVNMDICGKPALALRMRDSNPGFVSLKPGGVGRNIAHNLCLLGMDVSLIAAIGGGAMTGTWFGLEGAMDVPLLRSLVVPTFANYPEYFNSPPPSSRTAS